MAGPLDGFRIIDLTSVISGPLATMILADQGAEVIKVEDPKRGDFARQMAHQYDGCSSTFLNNNRNKRSLALDLKQPRGLEVLMRLLSRADVLMQNFRPGVAERMGLGEEAVRAVRSDIVYVSICGYGGQGPLADKPVFDPLIQAVSGLATLQAGSDSAPPRLIQTYLPDKLTAVQASQAVTAALLSRARTGRGQHVRLSMLATVVSFLWSSDMGRHTFREEDDGAAGDRGHPQDCDDEPQSIADLIYETADGYIALSAMRDQDWRSLARIVDHPEWVQDARFRTPALRELNRSRRLELTQAALRGRGSAEWLDRLWAAGVPAAPVLTRRQMREHPQVTANALVLETDHPIAGRLRQARPPATFSGFPAVAPRPAPGLGEHSREILAGAGLGEQEIAALESSGVLLQQRS